MASIHESKSCEDGSLKSSDWCLFKDEDDFVNYDSKNLAHSTIPSDVFSSPKQRNEHMIRPGPRGLSGLLTSSEIAYLRRRPEEAKDDLKDLDSPGKVSAEIIRLRDLIQERGIDDDTRKFCKERLGYLNMILEDYGYYSVTG